MHSSANKINTSIITESNGMHKAILIHSEGNGRKHKMGREIEMRDEKSMIIYEQSERIETYKFTITLRSCISYLHLI